MSQIKNLPQNAKKLVITRYTPRALDLKKHNLTWMSELAPSDLLLGAYKDKSITWNTFRDKFKEELVTRKDTKEAIQEINNMLKNGEDVFLICYEKNYAECHRSILLENFNKEYVMGEWSKNVTN